MKRALLVGINDYQNIGDLNGCVNDVVDVENLLVETLGYHDGHIMRITNRRATKENIMSDLTDFVEVSRPRDHLFFYFSGHGSQVADQDGDELDTKDELLCPHDHNWKTKTFIRDDDLWNVFSFLNHDVLLETVIDSCHSGTVTRSANPRERFSPPPPDMMFRKGARHRTIARSVVDHPNHVLWAACRADQTSQEFWSMGRFRGAFTQAWCSEVRSNPLDNRDNTLSRVRNRLRRFSQVPQLSFGGG